jgi:tetratricopeptide (TPR) repeat protein
VIAVLLIVLAQVGAAAPVELLDRHLEAGRQQEAAALVGRMLEPPGPTVELARGAAGVCIQRGQPALAVRILVGAAQRHPDRALRADLASAQYLADQFVEAAATLDAMARGGTLPPPLVSLRGLCALRLGKREEALRQLRAAIAADPNEGSANFYLGTLAAESGNPQLATRYLAVAARTYRDRYAARYNLTLALYDAGRWEEALRGLEEMIGGGRGGTAEVENLLARGYDHLDRVKEAVDAYQRAIRLEPRSAVHYFDLGLMALRRRSYELAQMVLEAAVRNLPDDRNLSLALGATLQLRGQMDKAQAVFAGLRERRPSDPVVYVYLGNSLFEAGRFEDAAAAFTKSTELDPRNGRAFYQAAVSLVKLGRETDPRARRWLERAIELEPKLAPAYYQLAKLAAEGDAAQAEKLLARSLELDPELSEAHFLRARLCRQRSDEACASRSLRRYEELRAHERERLEKERVTGILYKLERP